MKPTKKAIDLSIIIPLRNTKGYHREPRRLKTCLESIAAQTAADRLEVIVSDFGSDTYYRRKHAEIIKASGMGARVRHVVTETDEPWNISRARNVGLRAARGEYVVTLDVDCILSPGFCEKLLATISPERIVHCQVRELPEGYKGSLVDWPRMAAESTLRPKHGLGSCQAVSRAWAESIHGWDEKFVTWGAEDTDFRERAVLAGKTETWLDAAYFHQHHDQGNRQENTAQLAENRRRLDLTKARQLPLVRNPLEWGGKPSDPGADTAILITTFMRDDALFRCVKLCKKYYPTLPIYVADCGKPTPEKAQFLADYETTLIQAEFDAGVSATRNLGMAAIPARYKYVVILEDDIGLTQESDFRKWRAVLDADRKVAVAGGTLRPTTLGAPADQDQHYEGTLEIKDRTLYIREMEKPAWKDAGGVRYCLADIILNVFMMRREAWEAVKWDDRIKAAPEHCHWFLGLKKRTDFKAAYVPDVVLEHVKNPITEAAGAYETFRRRNSGFQYLAETWDIDYIWSSWHPRFGLPNPMNIRDKAEEKSGTKLRNLRSVVDILNRHKCTWWLEAGSCLGAIREGGFIGHDPDIDIGIMARDAVKLDAIRDDCLASGFEVYKEWEHEGRKVELSLTRAGIKVDLFLFFEDAAHPGVLWHGAFGFDKETPGKFGEFLPHVFPAELFDDLREIDFQGIRCYVPNPPEKYLTLRYGPDWKTPNKGYVYWRDCRAIDRNFFKPKPSVFIGGVWDMLHVGHLNIIGKCRELARSGKLTIGVLTDEAAARYKPRPIVPEKQRLALIRAIKGVDEAVLQNDTDPTADFKSLGYSPDYIVHGDDWDSVPGATYVRAHGGTVKIMPYTRDISTTSIRARVLERGAEGAPERPRPAGMEPIAIGIKTFMRAPTLWRNVEMIKKYCPFPFRFYIVDDGPIDDDKRYRYQRLESEGHRVIRLPFNAGLSVGRNAIVKESTERLVFITDDDVTMADGESWHNLLAVINAVPEAGLAAAVMRHEDGSYFATEGYAKGLRYERTGSLLKRLPAGRPLNRAGDDSDGPLYSIVDQTSNVFLARREMFNDVKWDPRIRIEHEHVDFFLALQQTKWKAAVCLDARATHLKSAPDRDYTSYRRNASPAYVLGKWKLSDIINQF